VSEVSVAIPVRNGGHLLEGTLRALSAQTVSHELIVCDSGSSDGSPELARAHGARVIEIDAREFGHGRTRNLLMEHARGARVAFVTQDAEPAGERWLQELLGGFELAGDVGLVYGPYRPRSGLGAAARLELERWFESLSPDGTARVERLSAGERAAPPASLIGRRGFFTDANACIAREAWRRAPFRDVGYAEDRLLALDVLRAGYAKAYVPAAAVLHSHEYGALEQLRRSFDEARALREVYGWAPPADPRSLIAGLRGELGATRRELARAEAGRAATLATLGGVSRHHLLRTTGTLLGSRADRLPAPLRARLSLERRPGFQPIDADTEGTPAPR
jgi:glycosyltransferase involved in cell wall biosynthesis